MKPQRSSKERDFIKTFGL